MPRVEKTPYYDVASYPITKFENIVKTADLPENARALVSRVMSPNADGQRHVHASMLLVENESKELEVHQWPLEPLGTIYASRAIPGRGTDPFSDCSLPQISRIRLFVT